MKDWKPKETQRRESGSRRTARMLEEAVENAFKVADVTNVYIKCRPFVFLNCEFSSNKKITSLFVRSGVFYNLRLLHTLIRNEETILGCRNVPWKMIDAYMYETMKELDDLAAIAVNFIPSEKALYLKLIRTYQLFTPCSNTFHSGKLRVETGV
ncbi:hypothetical protein HS088_TW09G01167 [Tripterygium wilfordii]|uniref:Uncharacterized protein n=1 Tax=Tripterygium wilfordii TaxID=458696 RepID=A0A7J7D9S9_TRIWF|nr:hypothetical protein HS088_TW09G01167 [Tripterygium wilfordii]